MFGFIDTFSNSVFCHYVCKDAATLIAIASPPYKEWKKTGSTLTRLDGPVLFSIKGKVFAEGRYDPMGYVRMYDMSSLLGEKRTALYRVEPDRLMRISDLPGCGDPPYPGGVLRNGIVSICYYANATERDYSWFLGLVMSSDVKLHV